MAAPSFRLQSVLDYRSNLVDSARLQLAGLQMRCTEEEQRLTQIEDTARLKQLDALACYALWREGRVVGLMVIGGAPQELTVEKLEVMSVLSGHIAVAIENCHLLEEKVKLERELAERERLASLGNMAAKRFLKTWHGVVCMTTNTKGQTSRASIP